MLTKVSGFQTTRVFTPWKDEVCSEDGYSWHEIARPQVHGHDINCVAIIQGKGNHRFVSGADEKVARVFEAPLSFLQTLSHAHFQNSNAPEYLQDDFQILGANMSALGLSQKPIYVQGGVEFSFFELHFTVTSVTIFLCFIIKYTCEGSMIYQ